MADVQTAAQAAQDDKPLFTCLSCLIAFLTAEEQRDHYRSDHHRYNMKRRVASLPPVSVAVFNQKVLERRQETAVALSPKGSTCEICNKAYTTENAYRSHMLSKKHRENEVKSLSQVDHPSPRPAEAAAAKASPLEDRTPEAFAETTNETPPTHSESTALGQPDADADDLDDENAATLDERIAAARSRLSPLHCLFCAHTSSSFEDNLTHMSSEHSFFIPDGEYLVDPTGLIAYLGEKLAVGNVCIYCNGKGREFRTLDAVRKHMVDKSHCKIAYDTENDMLEMSDFYDFSASYPDAEERQRRKEERRTKKTKKADNDAAEGWEDVENDDSGVEVDEVIDERPASSSSSPSSSSDEDKDEDEDDNEGGGDSSDSDADSLPENQITYGDSHLELVLPSGNRIGHRSMRRYYAQSFTATTTTSRRGGKKIANGEEDGRSIVRRLLADKHSALVPRKGGFGAFGAGTEVVKARNRGEAREAGRHVREFRDQKRKEDYKTRVAFAQNNQKHFRDPLLQ
ncbi:C2H2 type zinc-finger (2 copies) domain containing protein [Russula decolorans]